MQNFTCGGRVCLGKVVEAPSLRNPLAAFLCEQRIELLRLEDKPCFLRAHRAHLRQRFGFCADTLAFRFQRIGSRRRRRLLLGLLCFRRGLRLQCVLWLLAFNFSLA